MANIMLTDVCNLRCPYCFANEFVNKDKNEISEENFRKALDFIVGDGTHDTVGMIGGEPTRHSDFDHLMRVALADERVKGVMVYTNGILMDLFGDVLCHPKTHLLINCNPPENTGTYAYQKLWENIKTLVVSKMCRDRVTLGINMYSPDFEYDYILAMLEEFGFHHVRVSITVPNEDEGRTGDPFEYFLSMKPRMLEFFHKLMEKDILPNFDCNKIPSCLMTDKDLEFFADVLQSPFIMENLNKSNISNKEVHCAPVIDIRQDLTAVRCFGLSSCTKQNISDFSGIRELENYYLREIDAFACNTAYNSDCSSCHLRRVMKCSGGCLAYKAEKILELRNIAESKLPAGGVS